MIKSNSMLEGIVPMEYTPEEITFIANNPEQLEGLKKYGDFQISQAPIGENMVKTLAVYGRFEREAECTQGMDGCLGNLFEVRVESDGNKEIFKFICDNCGKIYYLENFLKMTGMSPGLIDKLVETTDIDSGNALVWE